LLVGEFGGRHGGAGKGLGEWGCQALAAMRRRPPVSSRQMPRKKE
jgi:hypothetical protein